MPDTYEVKAPDGSTIEIQSDGAPSQADALRAIRAYGDAQAAKAQAKAQEGASFGKQMLRTGLNALPGIGAIVGGAISAPETGGVGTIPGMALGAGAGQGARDLIAHYSGLEPETSPTEKAARIGSETLKTGATAAILPGIVSAAKAPIETLRDATEQFGSAMPPAIRRLANLFPSLPQSQGRILTRPAWQSWGADVAPEASAAQSSAARPAPTSLSAADYASLVKRYGAQTAARIEQNLGSAPTPEPVPESPLRQPRIQQGAERVGRNAGLTKEQVRVQTGPVLNEARGEASPILPKDALGQIVDTMRALPPDQREAYVQRASSGKTMAQVENLRRTLEHLGLLVPAAAGAGLARQAMLSHLGSDQ